MNDAIHVLLIEDNPGDARLIREYLKDSEYANIRISTASLLGEAVKLHEDDPADLVLCDLALPDSDGLETVERILSKIKNSPVVVLTGSDDNDMAIRAVREGAQDYLVKNDITAPSLIRTIRHAIERFKLHEEMKHLAFHDQLTGLPNRSLFEKHLSYALLKAERNREWVTIYFIDLDLFKEVNDLLGHAGGDELLRQVAKRLESCLRKSDTIARLGGDEFALIQTHVEGLHNVKALCGKIMRLFTDPFMINDVPFETTCTFGVAIYPKDASNAEDLLNRADDALYEGKARGRNTYTIYGEQPGDTRQEA